MGKIHFGWVFLGTNFTGLKVGG